MIRLAAIILICLSSSLIGIYYGGKIPRRLAHLAEFKKCLLMLSSEIEFAVNTLPQAFVNIAHRSLLYEAFFLKITEGLDAGQSMAQAWAGGCPQLEQSCLAEEDISHIAALGGFLGSIDKELQINSIEMLIFSINNTAETLEPEGIKNKKLYRGLGTLMGLLIVIILI